MKPNREVIVSNQFSESGRSEQMAFDPHSLQHIMSVLTNLYSDPQMAIIREYSTNAYDSHVAAGKGEVPFHVTLPGAFSSEFIIRDFGTGLTEEEVFGVFGLYGASTKRDSDDYVGQLGLGCKSALAHVNQFSLTAIKNGIKCIFSVHKDELGVGRITKLYEGPTDEETGVEISVPIKDYRTFNSKARQFYRTFPVFPNFKNGDIKPEELKMEILLEVNDTTKVVKRTHEPHGVDMIIMGGVAYPYRSGFKVSDYGFIVVDAPIGAVDFTPSREELQMTARTKDFLASAFDQVREKVKEQTLAKITAARSLIEFQSLVASNRHILTSVGVRKLTYGGIEVDATYMYQEDVLGLDDFAVLSMSHDGILSMTCFQGTFVDSSKHYPKGSLRTAQLPHYNFVTGLTKLSSYEKGRIKIWMLQEGRKTVVVIPSMDDLHPDYKAAAKNVWSYTSVRDAANSYLRGTRQKKAKQNLYTRLRYNEYSRQVNFNSDVSTPDSNRATILYATRKVYVDYSTYLRGDSKIEMFSIPPNQEKGFLALNPLALTPAQYVIASVKRDLNDLNGRAKLLRAGMSLNSGYGTRGDKLQAIANQLPKFATLDTINDPELRNLLSDFALLRTGLYKDMTISKLLGRVQFVETHTTNTATKGELTILMDFIRKVGDKEWKEFVTLYDALRPKYPLLLEEESKTEYLIQYVNLIEKGE